MDLTSFFLWFCCWLLIALLFANRVWQEDPDSGGNGMECLVMFQSDLAVEAFLKEHGTVPIPPYFHRPAEASDAEAYNTIYANQGGSVAAPTAGLHFTDSVMAQLAGSKDTSCSFLTLHVGAGTFQPVVLEDARDHDMHAETFAVNVGQLRRIVQALEDDNQSLAVVGTTSCRTLESLYWCGVKRLTSLENTKQNWSLSLGQFEWLPLSVAATGKDISRTAALRALIEGMDDQEVIGGRTSLMIIPQLYEFKVVDHLITNFHAPDSTLMLLVSAFLQSGKKVKEVYEDGQENGFRFLSYGDSCMFSRPNP